MADKIDPKKIDVKTTPKKPAPGGFDVTQNKVSVEEVNSSQDSVMGSTEETPEIQEIPVNQVNQEVQPNNTQVKQQPEAQPQTESKPQNQPEKEEEPAQQENPEEENPEEDEKEKSEDEKEEEAEEEEPEEEEEKEEEQSEPEENEEENPENEEKEPEEESPETEESNTPENENAETPEAGETSASPEAAEGAEVAEGAETAEAAAAAEEAAVVAEEAVVAGEEVAAGAAGAPILLVALGVLVVILLVIIVIFGFMACQASQGYFGKSTPIPSGKDYANVKTVLTAANTQTKTSTGKNIKGYNQLNLNNNDKKFIEDGLADKRLLDALKYLSDRHASIGISHIIDGYQNMTVNPEAGESTSQINSNISAHKEGLAADIASVDFVYKVLEPSEYCQNLVASACGPLAFACKRAAKAAKWGDIVYYHEDVKQPNSNTTNVDANGNPVTSTDGSIDNTNLDQIGTSLEEINASNTDILARLEALQKKLSDQIANSGQNQAAQQDQIQRLQKIIDQYRITITKLNDLKTKLAKMVTSIQDMQTKLTTLNTNLGTASNVMSKLGAGSSTLNTLGDITKITGQVNQTLNITKTQLNKLIGGLNQIVITFVKQLSIAEAATNSTDLGNAIANLESSSSDASTLAGSDAISNLDTALPDLDIFKNTLDSAAMALAQKELDKLTNEAKDEAVSKVKDELNKAVGEKLGSALGSLGLGGSGNELLRQKCLGNLTSITPSNTNFNGTDYVQAIPIKLSWQDKKPDGLIDPRVYYMVYQPEARAKVHTVISELLQFPYDMNNKFYYRIVQLITYSQDRDVAPFWDKLIDLYGLPRPANFGLFSMPEASDQIHVSY
ncbi:MAG: hypothetical protein WCP93_01115 [Candidatus Berkelbacteria bacterium]